MREFKYYPEDFGSLKVDVGHMDLCFDVHETETHVSSDLHLKAREELSEVALNAKDLEVHSVDCDSADIEHRYDKEKDLLVVKFKKPLEKGTSFTLHTETTCRPSRNILEGLYYDETPSGAPCQLITQCQQWGFQRIVPCIDDMTAKCTYKTTIIADGKYTHLLTNGDVSVPRERLEGGRDRIRYDNTVTPMATYLFFLGCGTYASFTREFEYPDGKTFTLELLVPPGSDEEAARRALDILHDGILWIHLFTGPETYGKPELRQEIKKLVEEREALKKEEEPSGLAELRATLREKIRQITPGYQYTGTVYREIGMQNSNFGGMENVGNTTITTNRIMPFPDMTDSSFEYMIRVKVHEFYHNLNGSEVTGRSPFEIWLNEAVTVFMETKYHAFLFGEDSSRLDTVLTLLSPVGGTFTLDDAADSMPVEPDGFNHPDELITGMTYVKAPEFVRMIETLVGKEAFARGLHRYHSTYRHSNASREQWIEAMEHASGLELKKMAQGWLKQTGYPKVEVRKEVSGGKLVLKLRQKGFSLQPWEFPFVAAVFDTAGEQVGTEKTVRMQGEHAELVFEGVREIGFLSLNRGSSFYGKVEYPSSEEELHLQARRDTDIIGRYLAFRELSNREMIRIIEGGEPGRKFVELYLSFLSDEKLMKDVGTDILTIFEHTEDERYAHAYQKLYDAKRAILTALAKQHEETLRRLYARWSVAQDGGTYVEREVAAIKARGVKNVCLALLSKLDTEKEWALIREQLDSATSATDRNTAFALYLNSSAPDRMETLKVFEEEAKKSLVSWESFLSIVGGNDASDGLEIIRKVEGSGNFRIEQSNDQRALYGLFAANRKRSLLTAEGRSYLTEILKKLAPINEYTAGRMLNVFGSMDRMEEEHRGAVYGILADVLKTLDVKKTPSVVNTIKRILKNSPKCVKAYEKKFGKVKGI